ncbi:MAG: DUF3108 domain-containing protein [Acidobacteria bacterium]|nr:DUF3108 domain-containing protein [Acidobacteriota bacterium]
MLIGRIALCLIAAGSLAWCQSAAPARSSGASGVTPFARGEVLNYSVNWPSGLGLGEAQMKAGGGEPGWEFDFTIDAGLPGLDIKDRYHSRADSQLCSERLEKELAHGPRKTKETVAYDQQKRQAVRQTAGGGKSEIALPDCAKDALSYLYFLRRELANGRVPQAQAVNFGASYQVTATYSDSRQVEVGGARQQADRVQISFRGPASSHTFEILFGRDAARTPLVVRVPFTLGTFTLELVR